jgi:argininosuccinate lyase
MLARLGIVEAGDADAIGKGLAQVQAKSKRGHSRSRALDDIPMNVESRLANIVGPAAGYLQTARSRNDQVAVDFRLWVRDAIDGLILEIAELQRALAAARSKAGPHPFAVGSARHVRPSSARLCRNVGARRRALQGRPQAPQRVPARRRRASFPIDRTMTAHALGFDRPTANSLDSVADRNFALEALSATAITATHLSRFAEEIVLWTTPQFASAA